jgi:hypothetical protein
MTAAKTATKETVATNGAVAPEAVPIHVALARAMGDVQAIRKDSRVTSGPAQFNFRGVDAVMSAVGPAFRRHGVLCLPRAVSWTADDYATKTGTLMRRVILEVEFTFVGPDGSTLTCTTMGEAADSSDKSMSKAHSVAYRTALLQALTIPTDEPDPDQYSHERAVEPDPAREQGWRDLAARQEAWDDLRSTLNALPAEAAAPIRAWVSDRGVAFGSFTPAIAAELTAMVIAATGTADGPDPDPAGAAVAPSLPLADDDMEAPF